MGKRQAVGALAVVAVLWAVACAGGAPQGAPKNEPKIEPKANKYLKAMSNYLAGLKTFSFQVEEFFDVVQDDGQKLQLGNQRRMSVMRPDKVVGESEGDTKHSRFFYNGKTVTVYDPAYKTYAVVQVPGTIDAMLDDLHDKYGIEAPLSDLLFADPYKVFTENVQSGAYVGLHHVGKDKCHHLAFRQRILDWQIWIDAGAQPLPRKLVITFNRQYREPQYTAIIHKWDVNPQLSDTLFTFQPPPGVRKVDFLKRHTPPEFEKPAAAK